MEISREKQLTNGAKETTAQPGWLDSSSPEDRDLFLREEAGNQSTACYGSEMPQPHCVPSMLLNSTYGCTTECMTQNLNAAAS